MSKAGLSESFVYTTKTAAAAAANIRVSVPPHNKDEFPRGNDTIMFNIPCGKRGQYLNTRMSYLKFDLDVTYKVNNLDGKLANGTVPVLALDGSASSLIQHLELYHGTNLLEQIREYNAINQLVNDMTTDTTSKNHHSSIADGAPLVPTYHGERQGCVISPVTGIPLTSVNNRRPKWTTSFAADTVTVSNLTESYSHDTRTMIQHKNMFAAEMLATQTSKQGGYCSKTVTHTFCVPLMSGLIGPQQPKYFPVGALAADLRLELGLAPFRHAFKTVGVLKTTTAAEADGGAKSTQFSNALDDIYSLYSADYDSSHSIVLRNAELMLEYIEVASDVQSSIESATGGQYAFSFESFHNFQNSVPANQGTFTQLIGAKFSSVKTAISIFRASDHINNITKGGVTSRVNPFSELPNRPECYGHDFAGTAICNTKYNGGTGWYYSVGATHYPPKPVMSDQESYYEALKSQHLIASVPDNCTNLLNWTISARRDEGESKHYFKDCREDGTFFLAQNFESQSHKSQFAETGINTLAQNVYLHARFPVASNVFEDVQAYKIGESLLYIDNIDSAECYKVGPAIDSGALPPDSLDLTKRDNLLTAEDVFDALGYTTFEYDFYRIKYADFKSRGFTPATFNLLKFPFIYTAEGLKVDDDIAFEFYRHRIGVLVEDGYEIDPEFEDTYNDIVNTHRFSDNPEHYSYETVTETGGSVFTYIPVAPGISYKQQPANGVATPLTGATYWKQENANMQIDHFIHYDGVMLIVNGICNTRF